MRNEKYEFRVNSESCSTFRVHFAISDRKSEMGTLQISHVRRGRDAFGRGEEEEGGEGGEACG